MCPPRRRDLLGTAASSVPVLATGCLSTGVGNTTTSDDDGTGTDDSTATASADGPTASVGGEVAATEWLPAPAVLDADAYFAFGGDLDALRDAGVTDRARRRVRRVGYPLPGDVLAFETVTSFASIQARGAVCTFDEPTDEIRRRLAHAAADGNPAPNTPTATVAAGTTVASDDTADDGAGTASSSPATTTPGTRAPDGYEAYRAPGGVYWLGDDHLVYGQRTADVEAMNDARTGAVERYTANRDVEAVLDAAGDPDLFATVAREHGVVTTATAYAYGWRFEDDGVELVAPFAFPDADSTDPDAVGNVTERAGFDEYEDPSVATDGRVVALSASIPVSEFDLLGRDDDGDGGAGTRTESADRAPQVSFAFAVAQGKDGEWDGDEEERVVVTHQGGDHVDLANVELHYDGSDVAERDDVASTRPTGDSWMAGGEWTVRATGATFESGASVRVVWRSDDGNRSAVLGTYQLP